MNVGTINYILIALHLDVTALFYGVEYFYVPWF